MIKGNDFTIESADCTLIVFSSNVSLFNPLETNKTMSYSIRTYYRSPIGTVKIGRSHLTCIQQSVGAFSEKKKTQDRTWTKNDETQKHPGHSPLQK